MAAFGQVFSTTAKVLLALAIIAGAVAAVVTFVGSIPPSEPPRASAAQIEQPVDSKPTSMPKSEWDAAVAAAIKQHCAIRGMTKAEVLQALGTPTRQTNRAPDSSIGDEWVYSTPAGCRKYDGDNCVERATAESMIFFTVRGHANIGTVGGHCFEQPFFSKYYLKYGQ